MIKKILGVAVALVVSNAAIADSYNTEISGGLMRLSADNGADETVLGLGIEYHFNAVDTSDKPLAEAAFLTKSSNIGAATAVFNDADLSITVLSGEAYIPQAYIYGRLDYSMMRGDLDDESWTATFGATPIDGLLITTSTTEDVDYEFNLAAKYVTDIGGGRWINLEGGFEDTDDDVIVRIGGDFYFNAATSVGLSLTDNGDDNSVTLRGRHFFSNEFYAGASYESSDWIDTLALEAGLRF